MTLRFRVTDKPGGVCLDAHDVKLTTCAEITMLCRAVVSIRVFSPNDTTAPYISVCKEINDRNNDLCSIAGVDLPSPAQPVVEQTLAVEMVVYPYDDVPKDPDTGELVCPTGVQFNSDGFPIAAVQPCLEGMSCPPTPAIGGITYYHPGDAETVVDLGCTDLAQLNAATCSNVASIAVTASVEDFDTEVSVQSALADRLAVSVGEPGSTVIGTETHYHLNPGEVALLERTVNGGPVPSWKGSLDKAPIEDVCLEVFEDGAQATAAVLCKPWMAGKTSIDLAGIRLAKSTLTDILGALSEPVFPDNGLVVGIVLDNLGAPVPGATVAATSGSVVYLSADRHNLIAGGTSSSGIFVSRDAPFKSLFTASTMLQTTTAELGGLVDNKVTIVVLQFSTPVGN